MHTRRLVAFILGVWLGGMLLVAYTINANSSTTQNVLQSGGEAVRRTIELSGRERSILLLRHNTAEMNRSMLQSWEWMQLLLGLAVLATLPFAVRLQWGYVIAAGLMLLLVLAQRTLLTPEMIGMGRLTDMAGGNAWTQDELWKERRSLYTLGMLYWAFEIVKGLIGIGLTSTLLIFRRRSAQGSRASSRSSRSRRRENSDTIDDSDYGHIDGRVGAPD